MLRTSVVADHVISLDDARYFAARGVDYIVFHTSELMIGDIIEIKKWVAGINICLIISENELSEANQYLAAINAVGVGLAGQSAPYDPRGQIEPDKLISYQIKDDDVFMTIKGKKYRSYYHLLHDKGDGIDGIIVNKRDLSIPDIDSFEELDKIFDSLEEI